MSKRFRHAKKPIVIDMFFYETDEYEDQVGRNYVTGCGDIGMIQEDLLRATDDGLNLSPSSLAGMGNRILRLSTDYIDDIYIPNGWGEKRFGFIIKLLVYKSRDVEMYQIITGYTDKVDLSPFSELLDPELMLFPNNSFIIKRVETNGDRHGRGYRYFTVNNDCFIRTAYEEPDYNLMVQDKEHSLRSEDIFCAQQYAPARNSDRDTRDETYDGRTLLDESFRLARRDDCCIDDYMSKVLKNDVNIKSSLYNEERSVDTMQEAYINGYSEESDCYDQAMARNRAGNADDHHILRDLLYKDRTDDESGFTYATFIRNVSCDVEPYIFVGDDNKARRVRRGETEEWGGQNHDDIIPDYIKNTVTSIMLKNFIAEATVIITNRTLDGQIHARVSGMSPIFEGIEIDYLRDGIEDKLRYELGVTITRDNYETVEVVCRYNCTTGMKIEIRYDGETEPAVYNAAIFADSLTTPLRAPTQRPLIEIGNDFNELSDVLFDRLSTRRRNNRNDND